MNAAPVNLAELIHQVVVDAATTDPLRTISLKVSAPVIVQGDAHGLRRVVTNLVSNALRHTPRDAIVEVLLSSDEDAAILVVQDSGPGMTDEQASHAFDRFWQADASRSRSGAGLGLSIVRGIVVAHGGTVTLQSDITDGTRVSVMIPLDGAKESDPDGAAVAHAD